MSHETLWCLGPLVKLGSRGVLQVCRADLSLRTNQRLSGTYLISWYESIV